MARRTACITRWWTPSGTAALDKMMDFINNFVAEIRALAKKLAGKNPEAQAMLKHEEDWATDILRAYDQLMEEAGKREQEGKSAKNRESRYALKNSREQGQNPYSYQALTAKRDRVVVDLTDVGEISRDDAVRMGLANARKHADREDPHGAPMIYVEDLGKYVTVGASALRHGLDRRIKVNGEATAHIGDLLTQAIVVNEADPKKENHANTYILLGVAQNSSQENVYVRMVVNQSTGQLEDVTSLYAVSTKKEPGASSRRATGINPGTPAGSTITVAEILNNVKDIYSDILSKDVLQALNVINPINSELTKRLRYSLRNVDEDMAEMQRMMEENERLRELVGKLNDTLSAERGNGKHIDRKAVRKIAREMKKEYQSTVSVDDLAANLQKAFDAMASAQSTGDAESVHSTAMQNRSSVLSFSPNKQRPQRIHPAAGYLFLRPYPCFGSI